MENLLKFYIDGKWADPISGIVCNPSNLEELGKVALGNEKDVNVAVEAAKRAFETYSKTTKKDRLALLKELKFVTEKGSKIWRKLCGKKWALQFQWHVQLKLMQPLDI